MNLLITAWAWRPEIILLLAGLGGLYTVGWYRLRWQHPSSLTASWRLMAYLSGLTLLGIALMSPLDVLGRQLFTLHMVQHLVLMMIVPPLLLLANPFPLLVWGLPRPLRRIIGSWFQQHGFVRRGLQLTTPPIIAIFLFIGCLWLWHLPSAYDAALRSPLLHDLEHVVFFATAIFYWWHVVNAAPHIHTRLSHTTKIAYLIFTLPLSLLVGLIIAFADRPLYPHYASVPRLWGLSVMQDQMLGGVIMWVPGSMMYIIAAVVVVSQMLRES